MKILLMIFCFASFAALAQNGAAVGASGNAAGSVQMGSPNAGTGTTNQDTIFNGEPSRQNVDTIAPADSGTIRGTPTPNNRSRTRRSIDSNRGFRERGHRGADGQFYYDSGIDSNRFEEINDY